ncbi:MAG: hypothetical protein IJH65_03785 [Methanobrevibacter sp.]|nr:hypothetical protein [Methanobrevibacter sp.]
MDEEKEIEEKVEETALTVPENHLYVESGDIVNQIINEKDTEKLEELTKLFTLNQRKKDIARIDKLSKLLNLVDDEVSNRLIDTPESFNNDQLIKYMGTTQQTLTSLENNLTDKPIIQINNQRNEINITDSGLNRESRQKVFDTVMAILNKAADGDVIDIDVEENE